MWKAGTMTALGAVALLAANPAVAAEATDLTGGVPSVGTLVEALTPAPKTRGVRLTEPIEQAGSAAADLAVRFQFDSAELTPEARAVLDNLGTAITGDLAAYSFVLEGHTDGVGNEAYNQALSQRRADAVRAYLIEQYGVAPERLSSLGKGEHELLVPEDPAAAANRRVRVINGG